MYIDNQDDLESFVERAMSAEVLAIDTEFMREKTYYPRLCLLQMATDDETVIVDPFEVKNLRVLADLFTCPSVMKVLHAGRQDLEIFYYDIGVLPTPIFDTQAAATLLGHTQQIGYGPLVSAVCGVKIKKADSFTDWSRRPLTESQINYAAEDVIYLPKMYRKMTSALKEKGRLGWLTSEFEEMSNPDRYVIDERDRFRKLKHVGQLSRRQMAAAREMAAWREIQARKRNIPRKWVVTDEQIVEACKREPKSIDDLFMVRGMREHLTTRDARDVLALVRSALDASPETWPEVERTHRSERNVDAQVSVMSGIAALRARECGIALPTLVGKQDMVDIARGHIDDVEVLHGWRRELVGNELLAFANGELSVSVVDGELKVSQIEG